MILKGTVKDGFGFGYGYHYGDGSGYGFGNYGFGSGNGYGYGNGFGGEDSYGFTTGSFNVNLLERFRIQ